MPFRGERPHRRLADDRAQHAQRAGADADLDAAGDHRLLRLGAAVGVEDVERQALLAEEPGTVAPDRDAGVPEALLADGHFKRLRMRGGREQHGDDP